MKDLTASNAPSGTSALQLDGRTAVLGIVGDPVAQVKAPLPLTLRLQKSGLNAVLVPLHVPASSLPSVLDGLLAIRNLAGLVVTVPHKQVAARGSVHVSGRVAACGAANVLRRTHGTDGAASWEADLFDGVGFVHGLSRQGHAVAGRSVCLLGAGGAASAIAFALAEAGASMLRIHDIDAARSRSLIERLQSQGFQAAPWDGQDLDRAHVLVNATPLGMKPADPLPVPAPSLHPGLLVAEVVMEPARTALLEAASAHGCRVHRGRHMMEEQLNLMRDFFAPAIDALRRHGGAA